jgi:hypothetical protein
MDKIAVHLRRIAAGSDVVEKVVAAAKNVRASRKLFEKCATKLVGVTGNSNVERKIAR